MSHYAFSIIYLLHGQPSSSEAVYSQSSISCYWNSLHSPSNTLGTYAGGMHSSRHSKHYHFNAVDVASPKRHRDGIDFFTSRRWFMGSNYFRAGDVARYLSFRTIPVVSSTGQSGIHSRPSSATRPQYQHYSIAVISPALAAWRPLAVVDNADASDAFVSLFGE